MGGSLAIVAALFFALRPLYEARLEDAAVSSLLWGLAGTFVVMVASFSWLRWALAASHFAFQLAFLGGVTARLLLFGAMAGLACLASGVNSRGVALAMVAAFFPLTFLELFCLLRGRSAQVGEKDGKSSGTLQQDG